MPEDARIRMSYSRLVLGLSIVALGLAFTLENLHLVDIDFHSLLEIYWPVVFIALGVASVLQARSWPAYGGALIWLFVGGWLIAENLGLVDVSVWAFWPVALVLAGGYILFGGSSLREQLRDSGVHVGVIYRKPEEAPPDARAFTTASGATTTATGQGSGDRLVNALAVMSGVVRRIGSHDFRGGDLVAIMGGCKVDLREADIATSPARLDVFTVWGGIEIIVPERWGVDMHVLPFMGGADDHTVQPPDGAPRLVIRGMAVMGGVDVRNTPQ
jgi:hypothetical protein